MWHLQRNCSYRSPLQALIRIYSGLNHSKPRAVLINSYYRQTEECALWLRRSCCLVVGTWTNAIWSVKLLWWKLDQRSVSEEEKSGRRRKAERRKRKKRRSQKKERERTNEQLKRTSITVMVLEGGEIATWWLRRGMQERRTRKGKDKKERGIERINNHVTGLTHIYTVA